LFDVKCVKVETTIMNRKSLFIAGALLVAGLAGQAAQAHQWGCWIQADRNVKIRNASGGTQAQNAINDWNSMTILNISAVSSGEETYVFNANSGATGWGGIARITNYSGCTILRATDQLNTYYYSATSLSARGVHCQEIGHTFGLDHSNDGGCMGGGYWYDIATHYTPVSHNVTDIGNMYANRISTNPAFPTVGPEAGAPRIHAYWVNNPRTLRETTRLASDVVVATVTGVTDGKPIVDRTQDGYVSRIPTQRVTFSVMDTRKGSMVADETFVLFQNGDYNNRFDEDPSYKVGHTYLMFLTSRPDGMYLTVSPQGRYEISKDGLVPAAKDGFASSLKGARIEDVISDVQGALEQ
jgi:hypothetical protein